jgi:hypothetical protein
MTPVDCRPVERERTRSQKKEEKNKGEKRLRNNKVATRIVYAVGLLCRGIQGDRKKGSQQRVVASTVTLVVADTYTVRAVVYTTMIRVIRSNCFLPL